MASAPLPADPTLSEIRGALTPTVEAHLLDFSGELYHRTLALDLVARVRDTRKFDGVAELLEAIGDDVKRTRSILANSTGKS